MKEVIISMQKGVDSSGDINEKSRSDENNEGRHRMNGGLAPTG